MLMGINVGQASLNDDRHRNTLNLGPAKTFAKHLLPPGRKNVMEACRACHRFTTWQLATMAESLIRLKDSIVLDVFQDKEVASRSKEYVCMLFRLTHCHPCTRSSIAQIPQDKSLHCSIGMKFAVNSTLVSGKPLP